MNPNNTPLLPSHRIPVRHFELALVWPVFVQPRRLSDKLLRERLDPRKPDFLNQWARELCPESEHQLGAGSSRWRNVNSEYPPLDGNEADPAYSEFCYFHPFVRHFLYSNRDDIRERADNLSITDEIIRDTHNRNLRILERTDLQGAQLAIEYQMQPDQNEWAAGADQYLRSCFDITMCWLYLFDTQAAMLELKLCHKATTTRVELDDWQSRDLNLRMVLRLQDIVRRAYAPYWDSNQIAGHCPRKMELIKPGGATITSEFDNGLKTGSRASTRHVFEHREPITEKVFQELLNPIRPVKTCSAVNDSPLQFEHIGDERIPTFSYVAVDDPRRISTGDWIRLANLDDEGDSWSYPYSPEFLGSNPLAGFAYDRFWHPTGSPPGQDRFHRTRWLCSGYGLVGVGQHDPQGSEFFSNAHDGALAHFRHHYFALGMIAHFQRASLLQFKHALAEAAGNLHENDCDTRERRRRFRDATDRLIEEFLRFRTQYWFSEVSNQVQGRELFDMFGQHLRLQPLFDEVSADLENAETLLRSWDEEEQTQAAQQLSVVAALFLAIAPALDWLGTAMEKKFTWWGPSLFLFLLLLGGVLLFVELPRKWRLPRKQTEKKHWIAGVCAAIGLSGLIYCFCFS